MRSLLLGALALTLAFLSDDPARAAPGDQDTSFSADGELLYDIPGGTEEGHAVAIANGAIVVVGGYTAAGSGQSDDFALVRVNPSGGVQVRTTDMNNADETALGVAAMGTAGTIVATGFTRPPGPNQHFAIARYQPDLQLDPTFNAIGTASVNFGSNSLSTDVAIDSQFNIVAVGIAEAGGGEDDLALARLDPEDGALDPSFSGDGKQVTNLGGADQARAIAIDHSGRLVLAGYAGPAFGHDFGVVRYRALDGSLDPSFSQDGFVKTDFGGGGDGATDVAIQPDGKIVVAGTDLGDFLLARYNPDGSLDPSFSGDGKLRTDLGGSDIANAVAAQPDGRILAAGHSSTGSDNDFALVRYNPNGSLDTSFAGDGKQLTDLGGNDIAEGIALQPDGKIVLAGYQGDLYGLDNKFAIARFEGGGAPPDTDSDGLPDADDDCPTVAAATANGCPPVAPPADPFPAPPSPLPTPPPPGGGGQTGTAGADVFNGTAGNDVFRAGAGNDLLRGGPGADLLCGEAGDDQIDGEGGPDQLYGDFCPGVQLAARVRTSQAGEGNDVIRGGSGNDSLVGSGGNDRLTGGSGADRLDGGAGRDKLSGGVGNDRLAGGAGNDTLAGGAGKNRYSGGAGNDKLNSANGKKERVDCGAGRRDSARVDRVDRVKGCERVRRR
jgi:uncharacterized delta-60 repeat protein